MNKNSKILIIGFGSIGKRHFRNLLTLGYKQLTVFDPSNRAFAEHEKVVRIKELTETVLKNFEIAFICSPNNFHIKHSLACAKAGLHLFIEKPLSHNFAGVKKLIEICRKKRLITLVGCNMRFHPCLQYIKKYLTAGRLGKIYGIQHESGYYLPYWRPKQDYRKNYAAKRSTGGGIILDDTHEFDLLFWLNNFSAVIKSSLIFNNSGALEIETEDNCVASFQFANKVLGSVHCDYLQKHYSRSCKVVGERGNLEWDFKENIVWFKDKTESKKLFAVKNFDFNKVYIDEAAYFFSCIKNGWQTFNNVAKASVVLKYCLKR